PRGRRRQLVLLDDLGPNVRTKEQLELRPEGIEFDRAHGAGGDEVDHDAIEGFLYHSRLPDLGDIAKDVHDRRGMQDSPVRRDQEIEQPTFDGLDLREAATARTGSRIEAPDVSRAVPEGRKGQ